MTGDESSGGTPGQLQASGAVHCCDRFPNGLPTGMQGTEASQRGIPVVRILSPEGLVRASRGYGQQAQDSML